MRGWTVRYRVPTGPVVAVDVLADTAGEAVAAVRAVVPAMRPVETRGRHLLELADDDATPCGGCGHPAGAHVTEEWTGDGCGHVGHGHGNGVRQSFHPCGCQGFHLTY